MQVETTWIGPSWKAVIWVFPNALAALVVIVPFYILGVDDPGPWERPVQILVFVSLGCLVVLPVTAGLIHRSRQVALVTALCEAALVAVLAGLYFDFFGGWVLRGFHP